MRKNKNQISPNFERKRKTRKKKKKKFSNVLKELMRSKKNRYWQKKINSMNTRRNQLQKSMFHMTIRHMRRLLFLIQIKSKCLLFI